MPLDFIGHRLPSSSPSPYGIASYTLLENTQEFNDNSVMVPVNFPGVSLDVGIYQIEVELYCTQTTSALVSSAKMLLEFSGTYSTWEIEYDYRSADLTISDVHTTEAPLGAINVIPVTDVFTALFPAPNQTEGNFVLKANAIIEVTAQGLFTLQAGLDSNEGNTGWFLKYSFIKTTQIS